MTWRSLLPSDYSLHLLHDLLYTLHAYAVNTAAHPSPQHLDARGLALLFAARLWPLQALDLLASRAETDKLTPGLAHVILHPEVVYTP